MLLTAVDVELGACFFGIPADRIDAYRDTFRVPAEFRPIGCISVGYPDDPPSDELKTAIASRRKTQDTVVHRGHWNSTCP